MKEVKEIEVMTNTQGDVIGILRIIEGDAYLGYMLTMSNDEVCFDFIDEKRNLIEWAKDVCSQNDYHLINY